MFLLFGLRTKDRIVGNDVMTCEICGYTVPQARIQVTTKFTLFFVPLFPVRRARHFLRCSHCMGYRPAPGEFAVRR